MSPDFWERCVAAGCVVLPVKVYSAYVDGNLHPSTYLGVRYAALQLDNSAVGPDYWFMIDDGSSGLHSLFDSPQAALDAFERRTGKPE